MNCRKDLRGFDLGRYSINAIMPNPTIHFAAIIANEKPLSIDGFNQM
jgi:hypothetical protein